LGRWPLANLTPLAAAATVAGGTVLTFAAVPNSVATGQPASHANIPAGTTVAATTATTVTLSAALQGTVDQGDTVLFGLSVAQTQGTVGQLVPLGPNVDYSWVAEDGSLLRLNAFTGVVMFWEAWPTTVSYYAGYPAIPADLQGVALEWIAWRYYERKWGDPTLRSREQPGIGTETRWVGGPPASGSVPDAIRGILDGYRERVIA
jgi:hypothetical protein